MQEGPGTTANERRALAALVHPISVAALVVWLANDHWWKDRYGNALTGKLSDVAGLIVFPLLVAAALALWVRRPIRWGIGVTSVLYGSVNLFGWADSVIESVASIVAPAHLTRDPGDLLLLPVLVVPLLVWRNTSAATVRRSWAHALFALGVATTLATSSPDISTERFEGTLVLDRSQPVVQIPFELDDDGVAVDPTEYLQMGIDLTAFGQGGVDVGESRELVAVELVTGADRPVVEYRLADPETDAAPIEVRWSLWAHAEHHDERVSEALRLVVWPPDSETAGEVLARWSPDSTWPPEVRAARITATATDGSPGLFLAVVGRGQLAEHGFRAATPDEIVDLPANGLAELDIATACAGAPTCLFEAWVSWVPSIGLPGELRVYGDGVTAEITPLDYVDAGSATGFEDITVTAESRIEVPIDVRFGRELTPPEAITAHLDVEVEEFDLGSRLSQPDHPASIICCEDEDGLHLLGPTPDTEEYVAVAAVRRAHEQERFRMAVEASLRWIPDLAPAAEDPVISIGGFRIDE